MREGAAAPNFIFVIMNEICIIGSNLTAANV